MKTLEARERPTITPPHTSSDPTSRNNPELYQGGHQSSYNPNRPGLTSEISGELTAYAIRAPQNFAVFRIIPNTNSRFNQILEKKNIKTSLRKLNQLLINFSRSRISFRNYIIGLSDRKGINLRIVDDVL